MTDPIVDTGRVREVAEALSEAGLFALDLEFLSESRYVPVLALVQVAWGPPDDPHVALIDPLAADVAPVLEQVSDPGVTTVLHAAQGDLSLLSDRFGVVGAGVVDSQVAAAFLGLGDQIGYTRLIDALLGLSLDKSHQFTDWLERPLSAEQLHYAAADVRHLLPAWHLLADRLVELGRLTWVEEESARLAREAARRLPPEEAWAKVKGAERLSPVQLGRLRELAAWRERTALDTNTPPSWLIKDRPLLELARTPPDTPGELLRRRDVSERTVRRHGREILNALERGGREPLAIPRRATGLAGRHRTWIAVLQGLIQARCREADLAPRLVASRDDAETLVRWWIEGDRSVEPELPLLSGWRRELAGQAALDWLAGETAVAADPGDDSGLRLVPLPGGPPGEEE